MRRSHPPEEVRDSSVSIDVVIEDALRVLRGEFLEWKNLPVLTPRQIEVVSEIMQTDDLTYKLWGEELSLVKKYATVTSALIQESFNAGYNDFILRPHYSYDKIGINLAGGFRNFIRLHIIGDTGNELGLYSVSTKYTIVGNSGDEEGRYSCNCCFENQGTVGDMQGHSAVDPVFKNHGTVGDSQGFQSTRGIFENQSAVGEDQGIAGSENVFVNYASVSLYRGETNRYFVFSKEAFQVYKKRKCKESTNRVIRLDATGRICEVYTV